MRHHVALQLVLRLFKTHPQIAQLVGEPHARFFGALVAGFAILIDVFLGQRIQEFCRHRAAGGIVGQIQNSGER